VEPGEGTHVAFMLLELTTYTPEETYTTWFSNPCLILWAQKVEQDDVLFTQLTPFHVELYRNHWEPMLQEMLNAGVIAESSINEVVDECQEFEQHLDEPDSSIYIRTTLHCVN
jgi:hypothetical protein